MKIHLFGREEFGDVLETIGLLHSEEPRLTGRFERETEHVSLRDVPEVTLRLIRIQGARLDRFLPGKDILPDVLLAEVQ